MSVVSIRGVPTVAHDVRGGPEVAAGQAWGQVYRITD
jgi:hypothetical protein